MKRRLAAAFAIRQTERRGLRRIEDATASVSAEMTADFSARFMGICQKLKREADYKVHTPVCQLFRRQSLSENMDGIEFSTYTGH